MSTETDHLQLASEFPPASRDDWRKLVDGVLKGAPFEKLVAKTYDDLRIEPIYERAHGARTIAGREAATPWQIMQRVDHPDAASANAQALQDLENGANGLTLVFAGANSAHGFGLEPSAEALVRVLDGVYLDAGIGIEFHIGPESREMPGHFATLLKQKGVSPANVNVRFGFDPIGAAAVWGNSPYPWTNISKSFGQGISQFADIGFRGPFAVADGRVIHDAGGSEAQELAFVLAAGVAYLRSLEDAGVSLDAARRMIYARLSADADQFLTMAKFRALRLLWARVEQSCSITPEPIFIAAETAWRMLTQRDPYVNMLRSTVATFSAGLGSANSITVLPHTLALGLPDAFSRRIARNTQLVLLEESNLDKVTDPAAGSGGIEALTKQLSEAAWTLFQEIEKAGGAFAALEQNIIQKKVAVVKAARDINFAKRKDVLTGVSEFPNLHENDVHVLNIKPITLAPYGEAKVKFDALIPIRLAAPFEKLRDASDQILQNSGARPKVFLANLGTAADFTARATFARSFFETGGIETIDFSPSPLGGEGRRAASGWGDDTQSTPHPRPLPTASGGREKEDTTTALDFLALAAAFKSSGAALVCLCSSDKIYAAHAVPAAQTLAATGAKHIYLAGRPGEHEATFTESGIANFIYAGCDALATLNSAYARMKA